MELSLSSFHSSFFIVFTQHRRSLLVNNCVLSLSPLRFLEYSLQLKTSWFSAVIRGVSALIIEEETSSHMNLSDLLHRMILVFEVVIFTIINPYQTFFLIDALEFEVVEFCLFNPLQAFVSCVVMVFEVTVCGVAVHIIFNVGVREFNRCFVLIQGD